MDRINKKKHRLHNAIRNMTLRKFLSMLAIISLAVATFLSAFSEHLLSEIKVSRFGEYHGAPGEYPNQLIFVKEDGTPFNNEDFQVLRLIDWLSSLLPVIIFIGCAIAAAVVFYAVKLKKPIQILTKCADNIANNNLDFELEYKSKDEMGKLCFAFEKMRIELFTNNKKMWRMMEERKRLNAAFAHDLRTPITILKGYSQFLLKYIPQGKISQEKLITTVTYMEDSTQRLEEYVNTMNQVQKLEQISVVTKNYPVTEFWNMVQSELTVLSEKNQKKFQLFNQIDAKKIEIDDKIIMRVLENLFTNAFRYAKSTIQVTAQVKNNFLQVVVCDDGKGFSAEDLKMALQPFYKDKKQESGHHFGLGLNICKNLCEKHGGSIILANKEDGGAQVTAMFALNNNTV